MRRWIVESLANIADSLVARRCYLSIDMSGLYEGTGASSSGCEACDQPYLLELDELYMKAGKAVVVFNGIMVFVLLACLATTSRFAWTKNDWPARGRTEAYVVAVVAGTIYFLLSTIEGAMSWAVVETTLKFIVFDVFLDVSYRISDLFILAVVFGLIQSRVVVVHPVKWLILLVLGLLTTTAFALDTASTAILLRYGLSYGTNARVNNLTFDSEYVQLAYLAIYVVATMILFVFRVVFVLDDRSKACSRLSCQIIANNDVVLNHAHPCSWRSIRACSHRSHQHLICRVVKPLQRSL